MKCSRARQDKAVMGIVRPSDSLSQADLETMNGTLQNRGINREKNKEKKKGRRDKVIR